MADAIIKPSSKKTIAGCNFVAQDQIWKDHIKLEESAAKLWPRNWDFLTTKYEDLVKDESPKKTETKQELPPHLQPPPVTPIEKYISVGPSPKPVPATTAKMIGWRSGLPDLQLERYGKYANPKGGLVKQFNWPAEAVE